MSSDDFEELERETQGLLNVIGAARVGENGVPTVLVTRKLPEEDLPDDQLVANNTRLDRSEHDVIEVGEIRAEPEPEQEQEQERVPTYAEVCGEDDDDDAGEGEIDPESRRSYDPVPAGAEEQPAGRRWVGTGGPLVRITNSSKGRWDEQIDRGDVVRLSNYHVYIGGSESYQTGHQIIHPHGGREVGTVVGAVPLQDNVRVDVAARTVTEEDGWGAAGLGPRFGRGVHEDLSSDLIGTTLTKSGRTTDVTQGAVRAVGANVNVGYGNRTVRVRDTILTERMGAGGDSGSPVYVEESGDLISLHFAGSSQVSVSSPMTYVMEDFGVEPVTVWEPGTPPHKHAPPMHDGPMPIWWRFPFKIPFEWPFNLRKLLNRHTASEISERDFEDLVEQYFIEEFGEENVSRQHYYSEMVRYSDLMIETPVGNFACELENDFEAVFKGVGQTLVYSGPSEDWYPLVILPEEAVSPKDQPELSYLRRHVPILEFPVPDGPEDVE